MVICGKFCDVASHNRNHGHYLPRSNVQHPPSAVGNISFHLLYIAFVFFGYRYIHTKFHLLFKHYYLRACNLNNGDSRRFCAHPHVPCLCFSLSLSLFLTISLSLDHVDNVLYSYVSYFVVNPHAHLSHNTKQIYNIFFILLVVVVL